MSAWKLAAREVYNAGGKILFKRMWSPDSAVEAARRVGVIAKAGGPRAPGLLPPITLTSLGVDLCENRVEQYVPYFGHQPNGGRAPGSHRRWRATWLAALPRTNEVRLTGAVRRTQDDGTCYW